MHLKISCIAPEKLQLQTIAKQKSTLWRVADVFRQTSLTNVPNNHYETIIYYRKIFSSFHLEIVFCFQNWSDLLWEKIVPATEKKLLEFEVEKILRSLEPVNRSVQLLKQNAFLICSWRLLRFNIYTPIPRIAGILVPGKKPRYTKIALVGLY